jgi:hypothetical protein
MRYHFHIESDTTMCIDHLGREFGDSPSVRFHAQELARSLAHDPNWHKATIRVVDAGNTEVMTLPVPELADASATPERRSRRA